MKFKLYRYERVIYKVYENRTWACISDSEKEWSELYTDKLFTDEDIRLSVEIPLKDAFLRFL